MKRLEITLPIPMPTWNRILQMHPWQRKKLRDFLHLFVGQRVKGEELCPVRIQEYIALIRPSEKNKMAAKSSHAAIAKKRKA